MDAIKGKVSILCQAIAPIYIFKTGSQSAEILKRVSSRDGKKRAEFNLGRKSLMVWLHTNDAIPPESLAFETNSCTRGRKS